MSHCCPLPDAREWWVKADESDDWRAEFWQCPQCRQTYVVQTPDFCHECGRVYDTGYQWLPTGDILIGPEEKPEPASALPPLVLPDIAVARGGIRFGVRKP